MKGMQKRQFRPGQNPQMETDVLGFEVQPTMVLIGTLGFIVAVILLHFFGKVVA
jgi:hypothetical protein